MKIKVSDLSEAYGEGEMFFVDEQLYPESRGFRVYPFKTLAEAKKFAETGEK